MTFKIICAEERLAAPRRIKMAIFGPSGVGKTSLLRGLTIPALFVDLEGGDLSVADCPVDSIKIRRWEEARDLACLIGGPNLAAAQTEPYSLAHFEHVQQVIGAREEVLAKYELMFIDSITALSRMCMVWSEVQPENVTPKGAKDTRGAYGLMGREMLKMLTHLQHTPDKHVVFVGILDGKTDDFNRRVWEPQMEGAKVGREMPGIVDEVLSMVAMDDPSQPGTKRRVFVTQQTNEWGYPAKDRSGRLDPIERADLQYVINKINAQQGDNT